MVQDQPITLSAHGDTQHIAPLADLLVVQEINGLVFPHGAGAGCRQRPCVGGVGFGVDGQPGKRTVYTPLHPDFQGSGFAFVPENNGVSCLKLDI